jgi:hypothetical protein
MRAERRFAARFAQCSSVPLLGSFEHDGRASRGASTGEDIMAQNEAAEHHRRAAESFENAAVHHRMAAEQHERGNDVEAVHHATQARRHHEQGMRHEQEAEKRSAT